MSELRSPQPTNATDARTVVASPVETLASERPTTSGVLVAPPTPPPSPNSTAPSPGPILRELRGPIWLGIVIIAAFFVGGGVWAARAPVGGAVIASGVVSPEGSRRTVQHLEGGIIREIRVHEGAEVKAGDVLIVLEDVSRLAEVGAMTTRLRAIAASEARLNAERRDEKSIAFDHPILQDRTNPEVASAIDQQINQFEARRSNDAGREGMLTQRIAQLEQQIVGAQRQLEGVRRQMQLVREEIADKQSLFDKGFARKPELLALQRAEADLLGEEGELISRIARSREQIGETKLQVLNVRQQRLEDIDRELAETQTKRAELEDQIRDSRDKLSRTMITAPLDGLVLDLRFKTIGGVIRPGEPVLDIVPLNEDLIIDARVAPTDIDDVQPGLAAFVVFPSYAQRNLHKVEANVLRVSPDAFHDERSGLSYFTAKISVDREHLHELDPEITLQPGLPAEVYISTKPRTLLQYLLQPAELVIERSFREH